MVKVFGPGVERTGLKANEPTHFTVDCSGAGDGKTDTHTHTVIIKTGKPTQTVLFGVTAVSICCRTAHTRRVTHLNFRCLHALQLPCTHKTLPFIFSVNYSLTHTHFPGISWLWSQGRSMLTGNSSRWPSRAEQRTYTQDHLPAQTNQIQKNIIHRTAFTSYVMAKVLLGLHG